MSSHNYSNVYTGTWTNWSRGSTLGLTLTLTQSDANLLTAFLAYFVTMVGTRLWKVACLIWHFNYTAPSPRDALHHQRQAILRNAADAVDGLIDLTRLTLAWRSVKNLPGLWARVLPVLAFSLFWVAAWTAAAGFSSQLSTSMGSEVLISGSNCGRWGGLPETNITKVATLIQPYWSKRTQSAASYSQQCYSPDVSGALECGTFVKKRIHSMINTAATCPFADTVCRSSDTNLLIDTGYLDSYNHFGLNTPPDQRFQYREVTHCAPLVTEGRKTLYNLTSDRSYTQYWYGARTMSANENFTYEYSNDDLWLSKQLKSGGARAPDYSLRVHDSYPYNGSLLTPYSSFVPIPEIQRLDADVVLIFLSANEITFAAETNDPWFRATEMVGHKSWDNNSGSGRVAVYYPEEPASPMACALQEQLCNPSLPEGSRCTPLGASYDTQDAYSALYRNASDQDRNRALWAYDAWFNTDSISDVIFTLGSQSLTARNSLSGNMQGPLPDNQWQLEVQHWHETSLALMQASFVETATGPNDPKVHEYVVKPSNAQEVQLCRSQKIITKGYVSFSMFGLLFLLISGVLAVAISFSLEPILGCLQRRAGVYHYSCSEWSINQTLQLQRLAYEEAGTCGKWSHTNEYVPVTEAGQNLALLDLSDPSHPRLSAPLDLTLVGSFQKSSTVAPDGEGDGDEGVGHAVSHPAVAQGQQQEGREDESITAAGINEVPVRETASSVSDQVVAQVQQKEGRKDEIVTTGGSKDAPAREAGN